MSSTRIYPAFQEDENGNVVVDDSISTPILKSETTEIEGTPLGSGRYKFDLIPNGLYKFYDDDVELPNILGVGEYIFDGTINANDIISGTLAEARLPTGINANKIAGGTVTNTVFGYIAGLTSSAQTQINNLITSLGGKLSKIADDVCAGLITFRKYPIVDDGVSIGGESDSILATGLPAPTLPNQLIPKSYADGLFASAVNSQESLNVREVFPEAINTTGKKYNSILGAANSFTGLNTSKLASVIINGAGTNQFITAAVGAMKDYITYRQLTRNFKIIVCDGSITKKTRFENSILVFGNDVGQGNVPGNREYNTPEIEDCIIYSFVNFKMTNGVFNRNKVIMAEGKTFTLKGTTECHDSYFNVVVLKDSYTRTDDNYYENCEGFVMLDSDPTSIIAP